MQALALRWVILLHGLCEHPVHVGVAEVYYNPRGGAVEVVQKLRADDLEDAMRRYTGDERFDVRANSRTKPLRSYYARHFALVVDGKKVAIRYLGEEEKEGSIWSYMECEDIASFGEVVVTNTLLMETFPSQLHIVHVRKDRETRSLRLSATQPSGRVHFGQQEGH